MFGSPVDSAFDGFTLHVVSAVVATFLVFTT